MAEHVLLPLRHALAEGLHSMTTRTYTVVGMTCDNCVRHVTEAVRAVPGVDTVEVVLDTGLLTVTGDAGIEDAAIDEAIDEAGYSLAG